MVKVDYSGLKPHELFDERTKIKEELENSFNDMNNFANNIEESIIVSENERKFVKLEDIFKRCIDDTEHLNEFIYSSQISILPKPIDFSLYEKKYAELKVDIGNRTSEYIKNKCEKILDRKTPKQKSKMRVVPEKVDYSVPFIIMSPTNRNLIKEDF